MHSFNDWGPADWVMVIGAVFAGIVSIVNSIKTNQTKKIVVESQAQIEHAVEQSKVNEEKIDIVHSLTNGNLTRTQQDLDLARRRLSFLEKVLAEISDKCTPGTIDSAKRKVEEGQAKIGKRRISDMRDLKKDEEETLRVAK